MGVLTDYFRATGAAAVVRALARADGGSPAVGPRPAFDGLEAKGIDPVVVLGQLVAAVRRVPWEAGLVREQPVWPTTAPPGPDGPEGEEDDPWVTGPWVMQLDDAVRDSLAALPDAEIPAVVARWALAEELQPASAEEVRPVAEELIRLARRARGADERLYCWICV
ncbi:hypothetical protein AB0D08_02280 [Kitasatospora sp. NPDC048540]|uniref:hypothetical protein n=1 Tax=unclassified Kitasatospora TaxID=2633591 RepID=UPI00053B2335|nr:hypothetical protein [Kitasatospora sp. MBT63]